MSAQGCVAAPLGEQLATAAPFPRTTHMVSNTADAEPPLLPVLPRACPACSLDTPAHASPAHTWLAATAEAEPPLLPPGTRSVSHGLKVGCAGREGENRACCVCLVVMLVAAKAGLAFSLLLPPSRQRSSRPRHRHAHYLPCTTPAAPT